MKIHYKDKWGIGCTITYAKEELPNADPRAIIAAFDQNIPGYSKEELEIAFETIQVEDDEAPNP
jgi:hypothetical protein